LLVCSRIVILSDPTAAFCTPKTPWQTPENSSFILHHLVE
jgi:hypothetical protein